MKEWYIAYVRSCQERNVAAILTKMDVEAYVPVQVVVRQWSDRKVKRNVLVLPRLVFIHCEGRERRNLLEAVPYLTSFMMDRATSSPAVVPQVQMERFSALVGGASEPVQIRRSADFTAGQKVRITSGALKGLQCEVIRENENNSYVAVRLGLLGAAVTKIEACCLEKI